MRTETREAEERHRNEQRAEINRERNLDAYETFTHLDIEVYVESKSFRINQYGDWEFKLVIPQEDRESILGMSKIVGMPMHVHITKGRVDTADGGDDG